MLMLSLNALANVGAFGGFGNSLKLETNADIQMVSEDISIKLVPSENPVQGNLKYLDEAHYDCNFVLRNLSNKEVDVKMGFPLSGNDNFMLRRKGDEILNHNFKAILNGEQLAVSYEKISVDKRFKHIFFWKTKFAPNEEKKLRVTYKTFGYTGLGMLTKKAYDHSAKYPKILKVLDFCVMQHYEYVTLTGNSWKGKIENAKFSIDVGEFERYLDKRGFLAKDEREKEDDRSKLLRDGLRYRHVVPQAWKMSGDGERIEWDYSPFEPKENIAISYHFTIIPQNIDQLNFLFQVLARDMLRKKKELSAEDKKHVACAILEFYGVKTNNPNLETYLKEQRWYPVKNPPSLDENLKSELLKYSN